MSGRRHDSAPSIQAGARLVSQPPAPTQGTVGDVGERMPNWDTWRFEIRTDPLELGQQLRSN